MHAVAPPANIKDKNGATLTKVGGNYVIPAGLGTQMGGNLFHTFIQFDLSKGEMATFGGANGLSNIFARVTGSRSYIDGTIKSPVNLYLMNSNGITFGQHAALDVAGSFAVTTADVLKFDDGGRFDALDPNADSLTAGNLSAYGFLGQKTSSIDVKYREFPPAPRGNEPGLNLVSAPGETLTFAGGSINFDAVDFSNAPVNISAPGGRLELAAVTKGDLKVNFAPGPKLGDVFFGNANLNSEGSGAGIVKRGLAVRAGTLEMQQTNAYTSGPVDVVATRTALLASGSKILSRTNNGEAAGNFSLRGGKVQLDNVAEIGSVAQQNATATGRAGKVSVVADKLSVRNGSKIKSTTVGAGDANSVSVRAHSLYISGDNNPTETTGVLSSSARDDGSLSGTPTPANAVVGRSGNVTVHADTLRILKGGSISGDTFEGGHGGNVSVFARDIKIFDGDGGAATKTGIFSDSNLPVSVGPGGNGGNVMVTADRLEIRDAGLISTKSVGSGRGGDTTVKVKQLYISRDGASSFTGIAADSATNDDTSVEAGPAGPGGNVRVEADVAQLVDGGQISASTQTQGRGGNVFVMAKDLLVDGFRGDVVSNISADSRSQAGAGGAGGEVEVIADRLQVSHGGRISATTFGSGKAGEVHVKARLALITGSQSDPITGILAVSASPDLPGAGGSVRAEFGALVLAGGTIAGNTLGPGRGGDVAVTADAARILTGGAISADTSGTGAGGSVMLTATDLFISAAGTTNRTGIFSTSSARGKGGGAGSVQVTAGRAQLTDSGAIAATSASSGKGGSVIVTADRLKLNNLSSVEASATGKGFAGSVDITVNEPLDVINGSGVRTTSAISDAGTVTIRSNTDINVRNGGSITVQALQGNAGSIALFTPHRLFLQFGALIAEAGMNGGNIFVDPTYLVFDRSIISANAVMVGGNILLVGDNFLTSGTPITATGSTAGTVQISAPPLDLSGALATLSAQLVDASLRFQERCAMRLGGEVSSFLVLGRGGVEDSPLDPPVIISRPVPAPPDLPLPAR